MGSREYPSSIIKLLTDDSAQCLGDWFAVPLSPDQAEKLLSDARNRLQQAYAQGKTGYLIRILELIACYWLERPIDHLYASLFAASGEGGNKALLELVYGQLLMSRRQATAITHLDTGFRLAADILEPAVYFEVMRRHNLLRSLRASTQPTLPQDLDVLLNEAKIVQRIGGKETCLKDAGRKTDTLG
jgi:hypothetical protein